MKDQASKADDYVQLLLKIFMKPNKQESPDVQSNQQVFDPFNSWFSQSVIFETKLAPFTANIWKKNII